MANPLIESDRFRSRFSCLQRHNVGLRRAHHARRFRAESNGLNSSEPDSYEYDRDIGFDLQIPAKPVFK